MKASELREKDVQQLQDELIESLKEQFKLRMQKGAQGDVRPSEFKRVRRDIARVKTILTEKKRAGDKA